MNGRKYRFGFFAMLICVLVAAAPGYGATNLWCDPAGCAVDFADSADTCANYAGPITYGQLPVCGFEGYVLKWSGGSWGCSQESAGYAQGTGILISAGTISANIGTGATQVAAGNHGHTDSYVDLTGDQTIGGTKTLSGILDIGPTTATTGVIKSGGVNLIHSFGGMNSFFAGKDAGNLTSVAMNSTGIGAYALHQNWSGNDNTATGTYALASTSEGEGNTATGVEALFNNTFGSYNTASGSAALDWNTEGSFNTAIGVAALFNNTGYTASYNTAIGYKAGYNQTYGSNNIYIGADVQGVAGESNTTYIGNGQTNAYIAGVLHADGTEISNVNAAALNGRTSTEIISAASDEKRTPISSLPYTISASGSYYLTGNLSTSGDGITVNADDVTIDLNGFTINGPGKSSGTGIGIHINVRKNVEVKNGTVTNFGVTGLDDQNSFSSGQRIVNLRVQDNAYGISLYGNSNLILNCSLTGNNGHGVYAGTGSTISGNTASFNGGLGAIRTGAASIINGNTVHNNATWGINAEAGGSLITGNMVYSNDGVGIRTMSGATITGNAAYSNIGIGISAGAGLIKNNTVYQNVEDGIFLSGYSLVDGNTSYGNGGANISTCPTCVFGLNMAP